MKMNDKRALATSIAAIMVTNKQFDGLLRSAGSLGSIVMHIPKDMAIKRLSGILTIKRLRKFFADQYERRFTAPELVELMYFYSTRTGTKMNNLSAPVGDNLAVFLGRCVNQSRKNWK